MKAAVFKAIGEPLAIEEKTDPAPDAGGVIVEIGRCGICGSDLHMTEDPVFGIRPGAVLGHEYAGEVVATGSEVSGLKTGDRVSVSPLRGCGACPTCASGYPAWCPDGRLDGGGYAQFSSVTQHQCVRLPDGISLEDAALAEPLSVALHGVTQSRLAPGMRVLVIGAGPIGLGVAFWARRLGAGHVAVMDLNDYQEERAMEMGATAFFSRTDGLVEAVNANMGAPPDIVYECVGKPGLIAQCVDHVRIRGTVVILGLCTQPDPFIPFQAVSKEVCLQTSAFFATQEFHMSIDALDAGDALPHAMITDTVSLAGMPPAFEALRKRTTQCKVMVAPHGS